VIAAGGGARRQVTSGEGYYPSWSRDGRWIYFYGRTSGGIETWKIPAEGGNGIQQTKRGGGPGIESVWKVPVEGGDETLVTSEQTNFMNMQQGRPRLARFQSTFTRAC
jgi:Tol biopolymer transport system component